MAKTSLRRGSQDEGNTEYFTGCPIGGGFIWYGLANKIPTNCMICNNSTLAIASYAKLNENLGGSWGTSGGNLNIPDLRGKFPRGVDGGAANDPDRASRVANATGGNTGDNVGTTQGHAFTAHGHVQNYSSTAGIGRYGTTDTGLSGGVFDTGSASGLTNGGNTSTVGSNETRPINANVYFVIRVS